MAGHQPRQVDTGGDMSDEGARPPLELGFAETRPRRLRLSGCSAAKRDHRVGGRVDVERGGSLRVPLLQPVRVEWRS